MIDSLVRLVPFVVLSCSCLCSFLVCLLTRTGSSRLIAHTWPIDGSILQGNGCMGQLHTEGTARLGAPVAAGARNLCACDSLGLQQDHRSW